MVIYTGHGGNDPATGRQVADQELTKQNLAIVRNEDNGIPIRVNASPSDLDVGTNIRIVFELMTGLQFMAELSTDNEQLKSSKIRFCKYTSKGNS